MYLTVNVSFLKLLHFSDRRKCELYLFVNSLKNVWALAQMLLENHYCTFPVAAPLCHVCDHIISVGFICVDFVQPLRKNHLGDIFVSFCSPGLCIEVRWSLLYL